MRKGFFLWLPIAALIFIVACGGSDDRDDGAVQPTAAPPKALAPTLVPLTDAERGYLTRIEDARSLFTAKASSASAVTAQTYVFKERLFEALQGAGVGTAFLDTLEALEMIEPPRRFVDEHALVIGVFEEKVRIDAEIGRAVDEADLVAFVVNNQRLALGDASTFGLSPVVCGAFSTQCKSSDPLPGGEYGLQLEEITGRLRVEVSGRNQVWSNERFRVLATDDEFFAAHAELWPEATSLYEEAIQAVTDLQPPEAMTEDHESLVQYLNSVLDWRQPGFEAIQAKDREGLEEVRQTGATLYCEARAALSPEFETILDVFFGGGCGGPR